MLLLPQVPSTFLDSSSTSNIFANPVLYPLTCLFCFCLFQEDISNYGIDWQGPVPPPCEENVEVPDTNCPLDDNCIQSLARLVPVEDLSINTAADVFVRTVECVTELLRSPVHS